MAWGDVNDRELDPDQVRQARRAGMEFFKVMQVYKKYHSNDVEMSPTRTPSRCGGSSHTHTHTSNAPDLF